MSQTTTVSISLDSDLMRQAEACAEREHRTMDDVVDLALQRYIARDAEWEEILLHTREAGRKLGIRTEEDVERLSDEFRRERHR